MVVSEFSPRTTLKFNVHTEAARGPGEPWGTWSFVKQDGLGSPRVSSSRLLASPPNSPGSPKGSLIGPLPRPGVEDRRVQYTCKVSNVSASPRYVRRSKGDLTKQGRCTSRQTSNRAWRNRSYPLSLVPGWSRGGSQSDKYAFVQSSSFGCRFTSIRGGRGRRLQPFLGESPHTADNCLSFLQCLHLPPCAPGRPGPLLGLTGEQVSVVDGC
jgi:hypothetical protein